MRLSPLPSRKPPFVSNSTPGPLQSFSQEGEGIDPLEILAKKEDATIQSRLFAIGKKTAPIFIEDIANVLKGSIDIVLLAPLGATVIAGAGLSNMLLRLMSRFVSGYMRCIENDTALAMLQPNQRLRSRWLTKAASLAAFASGLAVSVVIGLWAKKIFNIAGFEKDLQSTCLLYLQGRAFGLPATYSRYALEYQQRAAGYATSPMAITLLSNVVNTSLAYGLIHGIYGLPRLGIFGAALATAISDNVQLLGLWLAFYLQPPIISDDTEQQAAVVIDKSLLYRLHQQALPLAMESLADAIGYTLAPLILKQNNTQSLPAYQIAVHIHLFAKSLANAIAEASSICIGTALGSKEANRLLKAKQWAADGLKLNGLSMLLMALFYVCMGQKLLGFFSEDKAIRLQARQCLLLAGIGQFFVAYANTLKKALNVAQDVKVPAILATGVFWGTVPLLTWIFGDVLKLYARGAWLSFICEAAICSALFSWRWHKGRWQHCYLPTDASADHVV